MIRYESFAFEGKARKRFKSNRESEGCLDTVGRSGEADMNSPFSSSNDQRQRDQLTPENVCRVDEKEKDRAIREQCLQDNTRPFLAAEREGKSQV